MSKLIWIAFLATACMSLPSRADEVAMDSSTWSYGQMHEIHGKTLVRGRYVRGDMQQMAGGEHGAMGQVQTVPGNTEATGVGVINSVDKKKRILNITHEPMPDLGWPTMTMDLFVTKRVDLSGKEAGDKVSFKVKLGRDRQYRIIEMEEAQ